MKLKSKYESSLVLQDLEITDGVFRKKDGSIDDLELGININHNVDIISQNIFEVILEVTVCDNDEKLFVNVKEKARFSTNQSSMDSLIKNAIAIMFPYVRSYISMITTQPGMNPIVLPAMNITSMLNDK